MLKSLETKMYKSFFAHIFLKNRDRFTSNHNQNNHRPILHISSTAFHQWKCFILWSSVIIQEDSMLQQHSGCVSTCLRNYTNY